MTTAALRLSRPVPRDTGQMDQYSAAQRPLYEVKANLFKGLAHPHRVRVLEVLSAAPEVSVTDLLTDTGLEASHMSQHLAVLRRHNLVTSERRGSQVYYRLTYPEVADLLTVARGLLVAILADTQHRLTSVAHDATSPSATAESAY